MFSANQTAHESRKDTVVNIEATGTFVWNLATWATREAVNITAEQVPYGVDEFVRAGLTKEKATLIAPFMVKEAPVKFECKYHSTIRLPGNPPMGTVDVIIGKVVGIRIADEVLTDGKIDIKKTEPLLDAGTMNMQLFEIHFKWSFRVLLSLCCMVWKEMLRETRRNGR